MTKKVIYLRLLNEGFESCLTPSDDTNCEVHIRNGDKSKLILIRMRVMQTDDKKFYYFVREVVDAASL